MSLLQRAMAEFLGTFWLVFAACGAAVLSQFHPGGIGLLGVALAFGLALLTAAYALGELSGCHLNPAVTVGLWVGGRFPARYIPLYVLAQLAGAIAAAAVLQQVAQGTAAYDVVQHGLAANGYGAHSPGGYDLRSALAVELIASLFFVLVILGATRPASARYAPLAIGLALTVVHLFCIPVTNASVNPARSTGPALLQGGWALQQLWLFWLAPLLGAIAGGLLGRLLWKPAAG